MLILLLLCIPHKLCAKLDIQADKLIVEAFYDNDIPAENAKVKLLQQQKTLAEVTTDDRGMCTLAIPPAGDYLLEINAGGGHRTEVTFTIGAEAVAAAGDTKADVSNQRWWGTTVGVLIIVIATVLGRRVLK
jgi:hypothetical protein